MGPLNGLRRWAAHLFRHPFFDRRQYNTYARTVLAVSDQCIRSRVWPRKN